MEMTNHRINKILCFFFNTKSFSHYNNYSQAKQKSDEKIILYQKRKKREKKK
jgi:hypothetical protein